VPQEELAAELCLLAPARLEQLIPPMPRMMHAVLRALRGGDQSVSVALKVNVISIQCCSMLAGNLLLCLVPAGVQRVLHAPALVLLGCLRPLVWL